MQQSDRAQHEHRLKLLGGSGPDVLLVHGYGADRQTWTGTAAALSEHARVWALDLPGHGDASHLATQPSLDAIAAQLLPALLPVDGLPRHLIGHSLGGAIVLLCAAARPEQVASLSLLAPVGMGAGVSNEFLHQFTRLNEQQELLKLLQGTVYNPQLIPQQLAPLLLAQLSRKGVRAALQQSAQAIIQSAQPGLHNHTDKLQQAIDKVAASGLSRQVIWGRQDKINPIRSADQPRFGGHWHILEQCGHLPHIEHRKQVNSLLLKVLGHSGL